MNQRSYSHANTASTNIKHNNPPKYPQKHPSLPHSTSLRKIAVNNMPTFTPQIHQLPFELYPQKAKTQMSRQQLIERLLQNRKQRSEALLLQKLKKEDQYCSEKCTFQPSINAESKKIVQNRQKDNKEGSVKQKQTFQRLYQEGISRLKSLNDQTNTTQPEKQYPFHPTISDKAKQKTDLTPIYTRLYSIISEKRQNLKKLAKERQQREQKEKPEINYKSKEMLEKKKDFKKNVIERLFSCYRDRENNMQKMIEERQQEMVKQCTFQPSINLNIENNPNYSNCSDFLQRQQKQAMKQQQNMIRMKIQEQSVLFKPSINRLSALLIEAEREGQTQEQRIERLYNQPLFERQIEIAKIQQEIYKQCTFHPEINLISKALQGKPHIHRCKCHPQEQNYHFRPEINPKSRVLAEKHNASKIINNNRQMVDQMRLEMEYKEMKECTFKPKTLTNNYRSSNNKISLNDVRGVEEYQQRIEKVKQKKKDEEQLKERLFELNKRYQERSHTIAEPFKLTQKQPQIYRLKEQAQQQFVKLHPFKPQLISKLR